MLKNSLILFLFASLSFAAMPRPAGDVPFTALGKGVDNLTKYKGKVVLIEFFMTTCPDCQKSVKVLNNIQQEFKSHGVRVIGLAFRPDDDEAALKKFAEKYNVKYTLGTIDPVLMTTFGELTPEQHPTVPMVFFIDRNGMVQARYFASEPFMLEQYQEQNIRLKLMFYLQPGAAPAKAAAAAARK